MRYALLGLMLVSLGTTVAAQVQGPGLSLPRTTETTVDLTPSIGLRGWLGGRPGMLASDGLVASSMLMADWYPLSRGFRLSGGLAYGSMRLDPVLLSGSGAALRDSASGAGFAPRTWLTHGNPYIGIGWASLPGARGGPYLTADVGLMYQRGSLASWGCPGGVASGVCGDARLVEGLSAFEEARIAPMMSLGVGLRF